MTSFHCTHCNANWWPYEARAGVCPKCGGGTRRIVEAPDSGPISLRDQPPASLIVLAALWELPAVEPEGLAA